MSFLEMFSLSFSNVIHTNPLNVLSLLLPLPFLTSSRPQEVYASQRLKVGLHTPTILGGNSYLSWFYDGGKKRPTTHRHQQRAIPGYK